MKGSKPGPKKHKVCSECGEVIKEGRTMCSNYCMGGRAVEVQDNGKTFVCSKCGGAWPSDRDWCRNFCSNAFDLPALCVPLLFQALRLRNGRPNSTPSGRNLIRIDHGLIFGRRNVRIPQGKLRRAWLRSSPKRTTLSKRQLKRGFIPASAKPPRRPSPRRLR